MARLTEDELTAIRIKAHEHKQLKDTGQDLFAGEAAGWLAAKVAALILEIDILRSERDLARDGHNNRAYVVTFSGVGREKRSWTAHTYDPTEEWMIAEIKKRGGLGSQNISFILDIDTLEGVIYAGDTHVVGKFTLSRGNVVSFIPEV